MMKKSDPYLGDYASWLFGGGGHATKGLSCADVITGWPPFQGEEVCLARARKNLPSLWVRDWSGSHLETRKSLQPS